MTPFPIAKSWIPSLLAAAVVVGFLVVTRRGPVLGAFAESEARPAAQARAEAGGASSAAVVARPESRPPVGETAVAAPAVVARSASQPLVFAVSLRPSATSRGASDVFVGADRIGTLDRAGRAACLAELTRRASAAQKAAGSGVAELRASVTAASGTDHFDAGQVLAAIGAGGVRGAALDGASLFRGGPAAR